MYCCSCCCYALLFSSFLFFILSLSLSLSLCPACLLSLFALLVWQADASFLRLPFLPFLYLFAKTGTKFKRLIPERNPEALVADEKVRRIVFCSGAFYYDLIGSNGEIEKKILDNGNDSRSDGSRGTDDVAVVTIEQIAPFPFDLVAEQIAKYPNAEIVWAQEEPKNMGAWTHMLQRLDIVKLEVASRDYAAVPAPGSGARDKRRQQRVIDTVFNTDEK